MYVLGELHSEKTQTGIQTQDHISAREQRHQLLHPAALISTDKAVQTTPAEC